MKFVSINIIKSNDYQIVHINLSSIVLVFKNDEGSYIIRTNGYDYKVTSDSYIRICRELGI